MMSDLPVVTIDRPSHRYGVGEDAVFRISAPCDMTVDAVLMGDDRQVLSRHQLALQKDVATELNYALQKPGFLRCAVTAASGTDKTVQCIAAFDPEQIPCIHPEREDFSVFWENAVSGLRQIPADFKMTPEPVMAIHDFDFYRVSASNINGSRIYGYLSIPKKIYVPVPLVVTLGDYGPGFNAASMWTHREFLGIWQDPVCTLCLNVHDFEQVNSVADRKRNYETFCEKNNNYHYYMSGMEHPERSYLLRAILGCLRLTESVAALHCIDPRRIVWAGVGQGGDFGLYLCHLSDLFSAAIIGSPGYCKLDGVSPVFGGLPEFQKYTEEQRLFDGIFHAARIRIPVLLTVNYTNETAMPSVVYPVLRALKGERIVLESPDGNFKGTGKERMMRTWLRDRLGLYTK
ncbi:MAG: acetylxylan esterase [Lentisphaeria bacterium]|nr:acetylxylan esterase [Lentisphaeria bacterium]